MSKGIIKKEDKIQTVINGFFNEKNVYFEIGWYAVSKYNAPEKITGIAERDDRKYVLCGDHEICPYDFGNYRFVPDIADIDRRADELLKGAAEAGEEVEESSETALATRSKEDLASLKKAVLTKKQELEAVSIRAKQMLRRRINGMLEFAGHMNRQISVINKVMDTIKLYLGEEEEVICLREGEVSNAVPVIRQAVLYMDEEIAVIEDHGIDFREIDKFDKWVTKNYKHLIPEEKGIVIMKPRRNDKDYGDAHVNFIFNTENKRTYMLIRNGGNLYRIASSLHVGETVFPAKGEIEDLQDQLDSFTAEDHRNVRNKVHDHEFSFTERKKKKPEPTEKERRAGGFFSYEDWRKYTSNVLFQYRQTAFLIKGLIDRTTVFAPLPEGFDLGQLAYIYDDENLLPDGRKRFDEWRKDINSRIVQGSRVALREIQWIELSEIKRKDHHPESGIYSVEAEQKFKPYWSSREIRKFKILFMPGDKTVWTYYGHHDRTRRMAWWFENDARYLLNYDEVTIADCDFYIHSRIDRSDYLDMMPLLKQIRKLKDEEEAYEREFSKLLQGEGHTKEMIDESISWWKFKNKWKRAIQKDDTLALRMIRKRLGRKP